MISRILVPIDRPPTSEQALSVAMRIGRRAGAELHVVQTEAPFSLAAFIGPPPTSGHLRQEMEAKEEDYLETLAQRVEERGGIPAFTALMPGGGGELVERYAAEGEIDLVIMTLRGQGGPDRALSATVLDRLVRRLHVPVLLLRPSGGRGAPSRPRPFRRILVPLDGSSRSEEALDQAMRFGRLTGARFTLVHVVPAGIGIRPAGLPRSGVLGAARPRRGPSGRRGRISRRSRGAFAPPPVRWMPRASPTTGPPRRSSRRPGRARPIWSPWRPMGAVGHRDPRSAGWRRR